MHLQQSLSFRHNEEDVDFISLGERSFHEQAAGEVMS